MKSNCFHFQSALLVSATVITTTVMGSSPSHAFELIFSSPNVLTGIKGVSFTLPSTGKTRTYNVTLERGTIFDVYGNPPQFDVVTEIDARVAMEESALGIDFYLSNVSTDLSFLGEDIFYIPYAIDPVTEIASRWSSGKKIEDDDTASIDIRQVDFPADVPVVNAVLQPVPEPTFVTSLISLGILGGISTLKRKFE